MASTVRWAYGSRAQILYALFVVLLCTLAMVAGIRGLEYLGIENLSEPNDDFFIYFPIYSATTILLIVGLFVLVFPKNKLAHLGWRVRSLISEAFAGIIYFFVISFVLYLVLVLLKQTDWLTFKEQISSYSPTARFAFLLIGIHAAILEESVFRGYLQSGLVARYGKYPGILYTTLIFAFYHLSISFTGLVGKIILGLGYSFVRLDRSNLVAPTVAHILFWVVWGTF